MIQAIRKIFSPSVMHSALDQFGSVSAGDFILFSLLGMMVVVLVVLLRKVLKKETHVSDILTGLVLAVYVSIILQLTLICRESGSRIGIDLDVFHGLRGAENDYHWLMLAYVILNGLLFVPYGFVISLFSFVNERKIGIQFLLVLLLSFIASMSIECIQLITQRGYYETQDLLFNTLGGVIGWILFTIIYQLGAILLRKKREI